MLRSENISYTSRSKALLLSTMETETLSRPAISTHMHNIKSMSCNSKYQNTGSEKRMEILVLEHSC